MIIDSRSLPPDEELETQVCIIGGGPVGITLAHEWMNQNFQVCLLESGGLDLDAETQALCDGTVVGEPYPDLKECRRRQLGGTAHYWEAPNRHNEAGFRCLPLDEIDFEQRDWVPYSGWPFPKSHLEPFYARAHRFCKLGPYSYDVADWEEHRAVRLPFQGDRMATTITHYAPKTPFTQEYRDEIQQAANIKVLLYANVTELETEAHTQTVSRVRVTHFQGRQFWVKAKIFILATGGLENARLLLASHGDRPHGLGNQNDLVGRFFMDRPVVRANLIPASPKLFDQTNLYDMYLAKGQYPVLGRLMLTEATLRQEQILNNGAQLFPKPLEHQTKATVALRTLVKGLRQRQLPQDSPTLVKHALRGGDYLLTAGFWAAIRSVPTLQRGDWSYLPLEKKRFSRFDVYYQIEQAPDPNNRITLSAERDRLGQPKTEIHWRLNPIDLESVYRVQQIWAEEFAKANLGTLQFDPKGAPLTLEKLAMHHHMGTTRMHIDPKQGVVDADCKVHGVANLYIAGSSVFPTSGYANPTLTILALTLRLADQIKKVLNESTTPVGASMLGVNG